jgi:hypothetical protein
MEITAQENGCDIHDLMGDTGLRANWIGVAAKLKQAPDRAKCRGVNAGGNYRRHYNCLWDAARHRFASSYFRGQRSGGLGGWNGSRLFEDGIAEIAKGVD